MAAVTEHVRAIARTLGDLEDVETAVTAAKKRLVAELDHLVGPDFDVEALEAMWVQISAEKVTANV